MKKLLLSFVCFVVFLIAAFGQTADSSGTGFFITNNGVIVTCAHVIEGANRIVVKVNNKEYPAEVIRRDDDNDLAILRINFNNPFHFKLVDFNTTNLGDRLSILGFPLPDIITSDIRFTEGSLSARSGLKSMAAYFQHSAPTHPGNSGGPLFNNRFEVIGVVAAVIDDSFVRSETGLNPQNINFGVKSDFIFPLLGNIRPGNGNVRSVSDAEQATVQILCYFQRTAAVSGVRVTNNTGYTGYYLYIRPAGTSRWGSDLFGRDILRTGRSFNISSLPVSNNNLYDIRFVDLDDDTYTKLNVTIRPNQNIIFTFDDFDIVPTQATASYDGPPITIVNNTGYLVFYLYISPTTSETWGSDRLASNQTLANGQSVTVNLPHPLSITNKYDIMIEDSDGDTYTKFNVTVTANQRIIFTFADFDL
ncbi:MAG: serine protease [Treponema sp.]|jgi:hypothetical protein|nr:serine protease [Treponema sp.]